MGCENGIDRLSCQQEKTREAPSRRVSAFWNLTFSHASNALILVRTLVFVPWYLHYIPFKEYGAWLATGGVLSFLTVMDFGLSGVLTQRSAVAYGARDHEKLGGIIGTGIAILAVLAVASGLISAAICPFVPGLVHINGKLANRLGACILLAALANSLNIFGFAVGDVLKSLQRSLLPGFMLVASEVVNVLAIILCLLAHMGLYSIAIGLVSRSITLTMGDTLGFYILCGRQLGLKLRWVGSESRELWHLSINVFVSRILSALSNTTDTFLIGAIIGPEAAGVYSLTVRAHDMVRSIGGRFGGAVMPSMAHLHGEGNRKRFGEVFTMLLKCQTALAAIGLVGVVAFDRSFVNLWVGPKIYAGNAVSILISIWSIGYMVGGIVWQTLYAMGHIVKICRIVWLETAVRTVASIILIKLIGIVGAPVAALAAQTACMGLLLPLMWKAIDLPSDDYIRLLLNIILRLSLPTGIAIAVWLFAGSLRSWPHFALATGVYTLLALSIFIFLDRQLIDLLPFKRLRSNRISVIPG